MSQGMVNIGSAGIGNKQNTDILKSKSDKPSDWLIT